jgi:hypothetical protein
MHNDPDELLVQREYARMRRCSQRTVERERSSGTGCRYIKIGRAVRYRLGDIIEFIERHARLSTSEQEVSSRAGSAMETIEQAPSRPNRAKTQSIATGERRETAASATRRCEGGKPENPVPLDLQPRTEVPTRHTP